jgi:hypothetical protein
MVSIPLRIPMSDPEEATLVMSDPSEATQANPHPISQHRNPREIAEDEAGPIGKPDLDVVARKVSAATPHPPARSTQTAKSKRRGKRR